MAGIVEGFHRVGVLVYPLPHHEEGGFYIITGQNVNELLGILVAPGGVKADGDQLLIPLDAVDGQLTGGGSRTDGGGVMDGAEHGRGGQEAESGGPAAPGQDENAEGTEAGGQSDHLPSKVVVYSYEGRRKNRTERRKPRRRPAGLCRGIPYNIYAAVMSGTGGMLSGWGRSRCPGHNR